MIMIDLPIPESCWECPCEYQAYKCQVNDRFLEHDNSSVRPDWCPIITEQSDDN